MRICGIILSLSALFWGFLDAPFFHVHAEERDHPAAPPVHAHVHVAAPAPGSPTLINIDDDAIDVLWSISAPHAPAFPPALEASQHIALPEPSLAVAAFPVPRTQSHDPPLLHPRHPRAPPA